MSFKAVFGGTMGCLTAIGLACLLCLVVVVGCPMAIVTMKNSAIKARELEEQKAAEQGDNGAPAPTP